MSKLDNLKNESMIGEKIELLRAIKDVIGYYERAIECKQENPVLFALQMALRVEEIRVKDNTVKE